MAAVSRVKDRRQVNVPVDQDRRRPGRDRRSCPECGGKLDQVVRKLASGTVTAATCMACGWSRSSRQVDADVLVLKMAWSLELVPHGGQLALVLPQELTAAVRAKAGDAWDLQPLTSPLGSLPMKWSLQVKKPKARR